MNKIEIGEEVPQQYVAFKKAEIYWKENAPKGKKYIGFKLKPFKKK